MTMVFWINFELNKRHARYLHTKQYQSAYFAALQRTDMVFLLPD